MDCVNEILSKNCVPADFEQFLLRLFQQTFHLLQRITKDTGLNSTVHKLQELDERLGKCLESLVSSVMTCSTIVPFSFTDI